MKKIFYLFAVACMIMACEESNNKITEPTGLSVASEGTAGSKVSVTGQDIAKDAAFYLENSESRTQLEAEILESGAEVTLPYTLGEYTLYIEQNGTSYSAGKITVAVTGIVLPEEATIGDAVTITANGFASDAAIFFGNTDTKAALAGNTFTLTVPADMPAGETEVSVKQAGTEQLLGKVTLANAKKLIIKIVTDFSGEHEIKYEAGSPAAFVSNDEEIKITKNGNVYSFKGESRSWDFTVEDSKVVSIVIDGGESHPWTYDEKGHLTSYWTDNISAEGEGLVEYLSGDNFGTYFGYEYNDPSLVNNPDSIDLAALFPIVGFSESDTIDIYVAAAMLGWVGTPSVNLPSGLYGTPFRYTFDNDNYVTSMEATYMCSITVTYNR